MRCTPKTLLVNFLQSLVLRFLKFGAALTFSTSSKDITEWREITAFESQPANIPIPEGAASSHAYGGLPVDVSYPGDLTILENTGFVVGEDEECSEVIVEGTGAMRAYQEMVHSVSQQNDEHRAKWKKLLYQYCELDTAAMVIIALYWAEYN